MEWMGLLVGLLALWGSARAARGARATRRGRRWAAALLSGALALGGTLLLLAAGTWLWSTHRPRPTPVQRPLFQGVTYVRDVRESPRPLVIHVVRIDLDAPGLRFLVTPGQPLPGRELSARTTSQFLDEFDLQLAINGDFFEPWWSNHPADYYPHVKDPVDIRGFAASEGVVYSRGRRDSGTLFLSPENDAQFHPPAAPFNAISGTVLFVRDGQPALRQRQPRYYRSLHPRTAVALDAAAATLLLIVVDGRQPRYSEGVTLAELADIVIEYGGHTALNLDGGGSSTLVMEGAGGAPVRLNSPIDNRLPGRERPVGNHLGLYAQPLAEEARRQEGPLLP